MKKIFSTLLMLTACFLFVVTVSAATGNGTITYGGTPFELIEDTGTDVYATVRALFDNLSSGRSLTGRFQLY